MGCCALLFLRDRLWHFPCLGRFFVYVYLKYCIFESARVRYIFSKKSQRAGYGLPYLGGLTKLGKRTRLSLRKS